MAESVPHSARRLTLVVTSLEAGGAERVMAALANAWSQEGRDVTLITLHHARKDFFALSPAVTRLQLDVLGSSQGVADAVMSNIRRVRALRQAIRSSAPHAVIAFTDQTNVLTLLATRGLRVPVVVSERIDPTSHDIGRAWKAARRWAYPMARAVVVQTESVANWARTIVPAARVRVIPNPVASIRPAAIGARSLMPLPELPANFVAAMGSLGVRKGFDRLLRAFATATSDRPGWSLVILGEGEERTALEAQAASLGISTRVMLPGLIEYPGRVLERAGLFALSSSSEGFPNALLEAMSCGCAVVSFDCPSGPADLVQQGINGVLVPPNDEDALAAAIRSLIDDPARRAALGAAARDVNRRYSLAAVMHQWNTLLESLA